MISLLVSTFVCPSRHTYCCYTEIRTNPDPTRTHFPRFNTATFTCEYVFYCHSKLQYYRNNVLLELALRNPRKGLYNTNKHPNIVLVSGFWKRVSSHIVMLSTKKKKRHLSNPWEYYTHKHVVYTNLPISHIIIRFCIDFVRNKCLQDILHIANMPQQSKSVI